MPAIGPMELIILLTLALLIFGSRRLPEFGRSVGTGIREFKQAVTGEDRAPALVGAGSAPARRESVEDSEPAA